MKIYTSFYGNRYLSKDAFTVQVATSRPKGMIVDCVWARVFPDYKTMVEPIKKGQLSQNTYKMLYDEKLKNIGSENILSDLKGIGRLAQGRDLYLLCYCAAESFCHRKLLTDWIKENISDKDIEVIGEFGSDEKDASLQGVLDF